MDLLDLDLVRTLLAVVDQGSFAAAARTLGKTQSAVTQQMQRLEVSLGVALFEKAGRGKRLAPGGQRLLSHARRLMALNDQALRALQQEEAEATLRLGVDDDVTDALLPALLAGLARAAPLARWSRRRGEGAALLQALRRGEVDLLLSPRLDPALPGVTLRTSPVVWLCAEAFPYRRGDPLPLLLPGEASLFRQMALQALMACPEAAPAWHVGYEAGASAAPAQADLLAALGAGQGVAAASVELLDPSLRVLGPAEGLPRLPDVGYHLYVDGGGDNRGAPGNPLARRVFLDLAAARPVFGPAVAGGA